MNIDTIITNLDVQYYNNIVKYMKKYNIDNNIILEKFNKLTEKSTDSDSVTKSESCSAYDVNLYKKPWVKLNVIHKIIKIKEYVDNNQDIKNNQKEEIKEKLITFVKNKVLTKKNTVNYDEQNGIILSISENYLI